MALGGFVARGLPTLTLVLAAGLVGTPATITLLGVAFLKIPVSPSVNIVVFLRAVAASSRSLAKLPKLSPNRKGGESLKSASENRGFSLEFSCISMAFLRADVLW